MGEVEGLVGSPSDKHDQLLERSRHMISGSDLFYSAQDDNLTKSSISVNSHEGFDSEFIASGLFNSAQNEIRTESSIPLDTDERCGSEFISSGHATVEDDKEKSIDVLAQNNSHTSSDYYSMEEFYKKVKDLIFLSETGSQKENSCKECSFSRACKDKVMEHV